MVCCTLLALLLAGPALVLTGFSRRLGPRIFGTSPPQCALAWRLDITSQEPVPKNDKWQPQAFGFRSRYRSFVCAFRGIGHVLAHEHSAWLQLAAAVGVGAAGLALQITLADWRWIVLAIAGVLGAEACNTAIEKLADIVSPDYDQRIGVAKDVAAGAVLLSAIGAAIIGLLTFVPYVLASDASAAVPGLCRSLPVLE